MEYSCNDFCTDFGDSVDLSGFDLSDYLPLDNNVGDFGVSSELNDSVSGSMEIGGAGGGLLAAVLHPPIALPIDAGSSMQVERMNNGVERSDEKEEQDDGGAGYRVAFRTKSNMDILDDGFKWRKYGKKMVKHSPNPRNYFRCSSKGCHVKKRVEREKEDPSYVITTYEGVHNHESPCILYFDQHFSSINSHH